MEEAEGEGEGRGGGGSGRDGGAASAAGASALLLLPFASAFEVWRSREDQASFFSFGEEEGSTTAPGLGVVEKGKGGAVEVSRKKHCE